MPWRPASPSPPTGSTRSPIFLDDRLARDVADGRDGRALLLDAVLAPGGVCPDLCDALEAGGPYGAGWPGPRVAAGPVRIVKADIVGTNHLRLIVAGDDGRRVKAIAFRMADSPLGEAMLAASARPEIVARRPPEARRLGQPAGRRDPSRGCGMGVSPYLVAVRYGRERYLRHAAIERHRHDFGYVAVVLAGAYVEAGDRGRRRVEAGDLLVHEPFETHRNQMDSEGAEVLNLPLPAGAALPAAARAADPDLLARLCERDPAQAAEALESMLVAGPVAMHDWPDLLAADCLEGRPFRLSDWARRHGLAPATVSRGFARVYGVSPARYRARGPDSPRLA
jgi:AraC-like DNA-binding protein